MKLMVSVGFEPTKLTHCILSATPLTARERYLFFEFLFFFANYMYFFHYLGGLRLYQNRTEIVKFERLVKLKLCCV